MQSKSNAYYEHEVMEINIEGKISACSEITPDKFNVHQINNIAVAYPRLRQESKGATFALT